MKKAIILLLFSAFALPFLACGKSGLPTESSYGGSGEESSGIPGDSSDEPTPYGIDLAEGSFYNYGNINACAVYGDNGGRLTDGSGEGCDVIISDVDGTFGDWYGKTHATTLFAGKEPYFYIEDDFGFPSLVESSSIAFGVDGVIPERVELFYSNDGYNYSFYAGEMTCDDGVFTLVFTPSVLAKSVKYVIYAPLGKKVCPTAIHSYGTRKAERVKLSEGISYTIEGKTPEKYKKYTDDGVTLTDGVYGGNNLASGGFIACESAGKDGLMNRDFIQIKFDLGKIENISEIYLSAAAMESVSISEPEFISVKYSLDGVNFNDFSMSFNMGSLKKNGYTKKIYKAMRNYTVEARYINVNVYTSGASTVMLDEITVFGSQTPVAEPEYTFPIINNYVDLPIIRGGFYSFFTDYIQGYNSHHYYDEYRTYIQLKGFRELGMDVLILGGENLDYEKKITLIDPPAELAASGYRKGTGHGVYDLNEAVLSAADKLGMNVYLTTVKSLAYSELKGTADEKAAYIDAVIADAEVMICNLYEKYSSHPSFYGFYFADETCDYWLMQEKQAKTSLTRRLYKGQSDIIRSLDSELMIAIAPAAWRNDSPKGFGDNLCELIKNDSESSRPIIDYVFVQDCLGRFETITVPENFYTVYAEYLSACKEGVERAGAVFGNDTETFDVCYRIKRYDEITRSLELETPFSEFNLIFDLPHYFCANGRGSLDKYAFSDNDYICLQYAKLMKKLLG